MQCQKEVKNPKMENKMTLAKNRFISYAYYIDGNIMPCFGNTILLFSDTWWLSEDSVKELETRIKRDIEEKQEIDVLEVTLLGIN